MRFQTSSKDSKNFIRIKDGETVRGVFHGDPYEFRTHWINSKSVICTEDNNCPHCQVKKSTFRFRIHFIVKTDSGYEAKIMEQGWTVYDTLRSLHGDDYNLERTLIKITRRGSGMNDTTYSFIPIPNSTITDEQFQSFKKLKFPDLKDTGETETETDREEEFSSRTQHEVEDRVPF